MEFINVKSKDTIKFIKQLRSINFRGWDESDVTIIEFTKDEMDEHMEYEQDSYGEVPSTHEETLANWCDMGMLGIDYMLTREGTYLYATYEWI